MYYFKSIFLNYVVLNKEVSSLDMLSFLVVLYIVQEIDRTLIIIIERRYKRVIVVISLP
jgi:hypothetical protein